jgi:hypothetical protein
VLSCAFRRVEPNPDDPERKPALFLGRRAGQDAKLTISHERLSVEFSFTFVGLVPEASK